MYVLNKRQTDKLQSDRETETERHTDTETEAHTETESKEMRR